VTHREVKQFFIENWAPAIVKVHLVVGIKYDTVPNERCIFI